jgi:hypothetical protein
MSDTGASVPGGSDAGAMKRTGDAPVRNCCQMVRKRAATEIRMSRNPAGIQSRPVSVSMKLRL